jgi:hypothetical protein
VLRQSAIVVVLGFSTAHVAGVACLVATERRLNRVAEMAIAEAVLPQASLDDVLRQAGRLLDRQGYGDLSTSISIQRTGKPGGQPSRLRTGDWVSITLATPSRWALPPWLGRLVPWLAGEQISGTCMVKVP